MSDSRGLGQKPLLLAFSLAATSLSPHRPGEPHQTYPPLATCTHSGAFGDLRAWPSAHFAAGCLPIQPRFCSVGRPRVSSAPWLVAGVLEAQVLCVLPSRVPPQAGSVVRGLRSVQEPPGEWP